MQAQTETDIVETTTYTDVVKKFKEMINFYYTSKGCMITTVDDKFSKFFINKHPEIEWKETYNNYAESVVLSATINIYIFGKPFPVYLHRPIKQIHRWEYEYFFGFGGHNAGFSYDRIIMTFQERKDENIDIEYLLMTGMLDNAICGDSDGDDDSDGDGQADMSKKCCTIDEKYIKDVLKLLVVGGYVKQWYAYNNFKTWFKDRGFNLKFETSNTHTMTSFIFQDSSDDSKYRYEIVSKKSGET